MDISNAVVILICFEIDVADILESDIDLDYDNPACPNKIISAKVAGTT